MKILLVADEFFAWRVFGGFGMFTRKLGGELVKRGVEVDAVVQWISDEQKPVGETEVIDGVHVATLPRKKLAKLWNMKLYLTDADIIHSQCGMYDTYLTFKRNMNAKKILTFQDLRTGEEYNLTAPLERFGGYPWYKRPWARYVMNCYQKAVENADLIGVQAKLLIPKVLSTYNLQALPTFLPNFIDVPSDNIKKSERPSVVWLARLDLIKRPELCFELAKETPDVDFFVLGASHDEARDAWLRQKYQGIENLYLLGFQSGDVKEQILRESWILINTSIYECLPVSFLEACAHKCAVLSTQNPDDFAKNFGAWSEPTIKSLKENLEWLLNNEKWRVLGEKGYRYVKENHSTDKGVEAHLRVYQKLLDKDFGQEGTASE